MTREELNEMMPIVQTYISEKEIEVHNKENLTNVDKDYYEGWRTIKED